MNLINNLVSSKVTFFGDLECGCYYEDAYGRCVLKTGNKSVVDVETGHLWSEDEYDEYTDQFRKVEVTLTLEKYL